MSNARSQFATSTQCVSRAALTLLLAALTVVAGGSVASAQTIYPKLRTIGPDGTSGATFGTGLRQIAFQQASDRLYVLNTSPEATRKIYGFDTSVPGASTPLGGNFPMAVVASGGEPDLVTDNSAEPSAGNIYYTSESTQGIYGFDSTGAPLGGNFPVFPPSPRDLVGAGVDPSGNLWVGDWSARIARKYDSAGNEIGSVDASGQANGRPAHIAFASNGDMYIAHYQNAVWKYAAASGYDPLQAVEIDPVNTRAITVDRTTDTLYVAHANSVAAYDSAGTLTDTLATGISTQFRGVAIDEASKEIYVADSNNGGVVHLFATVVAPDVSTDGSSAVTRTTATVQGTVAPDPGGGGEVDDCYFEYGSTTSYGATVPCEPAPNFAAETEVEADLSGLTPETTYHFRLVAENENANSANAGADMTFTTPPAVAGIATGDADEQTQTTAMLHGSFEGNGEATTYYFEYGTTTAYGSTTAAPPGVSAGSPNGPTQVSAEATGLSVFLPDSPDYHYRLVAVNPVGTTKGPDKTFRTAPPDPPQISDVSAAPTATTAALSAQINPGNGPTIYIVQYGLDGSYGQSTTLSEPVAGDLEQHPATVEVTNLVPGTVYHYRFVAYNFGGTTQTADQTFVTPNVPRIDSSSASRLTQTEAHLSALIAGNASATTAHFEFGPTTAYGQRTPDAYAGADLFAGPVAADIGGLTPGTTYHFRVVANNAVGTTHGSDHAFTTATPPPVVHPKARSSNCGAIAKRAQRKSKQAKRLLRKAKKAGNPKGVRSLRRRASDAAKQARKLSKQAQSCRRAGGSA